MRKKYISIVLAALIIASSLPVTASAAVAVKETSAEDKGTFFFDSGDWNSESMCFYIWDGTTGENATKDGWVKDSTWAKSAQIGGTPVEGKAGVFESYEIDLTDRDDHDVYVIFHDKGNDIQTCDCLFNKTAFGLTASLTGNELENTVDSNKTTIEVAFDGGTDLGPAKVITSTGKIQGKVITANTDRADKVASFVLNYLGSTNADGTDVVTKEVVKKAIEEFGTTADAVWEKYLTYSDNEKYNEAEAAKVIKDIGTFFFDSGTWKSESMCFYIWDGTTGENATKDGWVKDGTWAKSALIGGTPVEGKAGVFESYAIDLTGRDDHNVYVIFHDKGNDIQTCDCLFNKTAFGLTASLTGNELENTIDSNKTTIEVAFDGGTDLGPAKVITSTGKIQGTVITANTDRADVVASFVLNYLGSTKTDGSEVVTKEVVKKAIEEFGTTADAVWEKYLTYSENEKYNEAEAKKVIKDIGTFFFDSGDWNSESVCFYIWDGTTGENATKDGWVKDSTWAKSAQIGGTPVEGKAGVFESYEIDLTGRDSHDVYVIFHDKGNDIQTCDCLFNSTAFGLTASLTGNELENPVDSNKTTIEVAFDGGTDLGPAKVITSTGKIQGTVITANTDRADKVASFVLNYLGATNADGTDVVTKEVVKKAIEEFGTTADDVWAKYQTYSADEKYNAEEAEKVILAKDDEKIGKLGDVDKDDKITSKDALLILRQSVNLEDFDENTKKLADVDGNEKINSADSLEVLRASVNIQSQYKIGELI